jgi:enoyl-[acyl-carrier protein] reductase/trans-2-enoyl-CoA reductase (NAD+)
MATTALGAIPGGLLMFALSAQILGERGQYRHPTLAAESMALFAPAWKEDVRLDAAYQEVCRSFLRAAV